MESIFKNLSANAKAKVEKLPAEARELVEAIVLAMRYSERDAVMDNIRDISFNKQQYFRPFYIDLSQDRSTVPLKISGTFNLIRAFQATDNNATATISFHYPEPSSTARLELKRGREIEGGFTEAYIYHSAQSGKSMTLLLGLSMPSARVAVRDDSGETANSDLVIALGNSSSITGSQASITTSESEIVPANTARKRVTLVNAGSAIVYINGTTATASHFPLLPGMAITLNTTDTVRGIAASGTQIIGILEE